MLCVAFAAFNCWLYSLGTWGVIVAVVIDKHVLVAYFCWMARVDQPRQQLPAGQVRKAA